MVQVVALSSESLFLIFHLKHWELDLEKGRISLQKRTAKLAASCVTESMDQPQLQNEANEYLDEQRRFQGIALLRAHALCIQAYLRAYPASSTTKPLPTNPLPPDILVSVHTLCWALDHSSDTSDGVFPPCAYLKEFLTALLAAFPGLVPSKSAAHAQTLALLQRIDDRGQL